MMPAGLWGSGSKTMTLYPNVCAAVVNIRPNWPPPSMPSVAPGKIIIKISVIVAEASLPALAHAGGA